MGKIIDIVIPKNEIDLLMREVNHGNCLLIEKTGSKVPVKQKINVEYFDSVLKSHYGYTHHHANGKKVKGLQFDPFNDSKAYDRSLV